MTSKIWTLRVFFNCFMRYVNGKFDQMLYNLAMTRRIMAMKNNFLTVFLEKLQKTGINFEKKIFKESNSEPG